MTNLPRLSVVFFVLFQACGPGLNLTPNGSGSATPCTGYCNAFALNGADHMTISQPFTPNQAAITVEAWIRLDSIPATNAYIAQIDFGATTLDFSISNLGRLSGFTPGASCSGQTGVSMISGSISLSIRHHVAASFFEGGAIELYLDGTQVNSVALPTGYFTSCANATNVNIGNNLASTEALNGVIDDFRISLSATPRYTGPTLTIPSAPLTIDGSTILLVNFDPLPSLGSPISGALPAATVSSVSGTFIASPF